jgi:hypothetical protein
MKNTKPSSPTFANISYADLVTVTGGADRNAANDAELNKQFKNAGYLFGKPGKQGAPLWMCAHNTLAPFNMENWQAAQCN